MDSLPGASGRDTTANSNGHCSTLEFRQGMLPVENGFHVHSQSFPPGRGAHNDEKGDTGSRKSAELLITGPSVESKGEGGLINRTFEDRCFSSPPLSNYPIPPPPPYCSQFSPQYLYSSSSSKINESSPPPPCLAVTPDEESTSRPESSHQTEERSSQTSTPSRPKTISSSVVSVSRATRVDDRAQHQHLHHHSPTHQIITDFRNTSSQSSGPNSSTEFEPETTDVEVSHALGGPSSSGRRSAPHRGTRLLNNTPVNCYQTDIGGPSHDSLLLGRRPTRLNFEPMTYDSNSNDEHVDKEVTAAATPWRISPTIPYENGAGVWTTGVDFRLAGRPPQGGLRRSPGPTSITRPFGHGTVTVTPLYRAPKTPPSMRHNTVAAGVTVTSCETTGIVSPRGTVDARSPVLKRGGMSEVVARSPDGQRGGPFSGRSVPTVSVTPCIADREIDISVCQSDVTVYDNVIDNVGV